MKRVNADSSSRAFNAVILIRILVGWVFVSEGIQKFLYPAQLGFGRFEEIGLPSPQVLAPVVGGIEILCGALVIVGLFTRLATIPLLCVILTAIVTTKLPMLNANSVWSTLHESRADFSMLLGLLFLLIVGSGGLALDSNGRNVG
jgi:uncharacterized membrane protein YphA (DoxX/SURF4 family)